VSQQIRCTNCGAVMVPGADGRTYACEYCRAKQQVAVDSQQIADGLRLDMANVDDFLHRLAHELHATMGPRTKLRLDGGQALEHFEINLDPDLYVARREASGLVTQHKKLVRGIALKTKAHPLDQWVQLLAQSLAAHANENARVALVISQLKRG
jgi:hypothetical protein